MTDIDTDPDPGPRIPAPRDPPPPPREPDLSYDAVRESLLGTAERGGAATKKWEKMLDVSARSETPPGFKPFAGGEADPNKPVSSLLESAVGADPSMAGLLSGLGSFMLTATNSPIASITDEYQVRKIRELQKKFMEDHDGVLRDLTEDQGKAKIAMRQLANMLDETNFDYTPLEHIMKEKRQTGDRERKRLDKAIATAKTPEEKAKLQAMKADLDKWTGERDARLEAEKPAYDLIHDKVYGLWDAVTDQQQSMRTAADSKGPVTITGGDPNRVLETTHTQPDAPIHVASLHNFLLQTRAQIGGR